MKTHSTKKNALFLSLISLMLCVSMLVGTTFAWFTDVVTSGINTIAAGVLDVELYHTNAAESDQPVNATTELFLDVNGDPILWEPGVVSWENLRVENAGDLALNWKLSINTDNENYVIDPVTGDYHGLSSVLKVGVVPGGITATDRAGVVDSVADELWTSMSAFLTGGQLLPEDEGTYEETVGIVIWWEPGENDNLWNLNNGKTLTSGEVLSIDLGVKLVASQMVYEEDSFTNDYDEEASYAFSGSYTYSASVTADGENKVAVSATIGNAGEVANAQVAAGTKLEAGTTEMTLTASTMDSSAANITANEGESVSSVDVHVTGLAADNTVPVLVTVKHMLRKYMNEGNFTLYHVENGTPVAMTLVDTPVNHNEYSYDPYTGNVTMALANFCEVTVVSDTVLTWEGATAKQFSGGTGVAGDPYLIASADQLVLMSKLVSGNTAVSHNVKGTTGFAGAHYKLVADIVFPGQKVTEAKEDDSLTFYPIGYWFSNEKDESSKPIYQYGATFTGTFDGQGHTISGIYQNTWQMNGYYNDGYSGMPYYWKAAMGLFGAVFDATIKNLTIKDFQSDGEFTPTGVVAAFAGGNSTFENITLESCNPRVYNTGNGGIVGLNYNSTEGKVDNLTFKNITVDQTNKITALWGSWDVSCGGILGRLRDNSLHGANVYNTATFENCHVAAIIDVYNDVCANYQYYQYRYCGMYIGTVDYVDTVGIQTIKDKGIVSASNSFVYVGDWNQYWYCELVENSLASYTHDHQFSRLTKIANVSEIWDGSNWTKTGNFVIPADAETKATCYHIRKDAEGNFYEHKHDVEDELNPNIYESFDLNGDGELNDLKEDRQHYHLPFNQLFTGYGWGSTPVIIADGAFPGIIVEEKYTDSDEKFTVKSENLNQQGVLIPTKTSYTVGELFAAKDGFDIQGESVQVFLSSPNNSLTITYTPNTSDWTQGTVEFSGSGYGTLSINDYSYCEPTKVQVAVEPDAAEHTAHCVCGNTGVGTSHETIQGWTPWDGTSDIVAAGNYYLTADVTESTKNSTQHWIGMRWDETGANESVVINLCLNGYSIASPNRVFGIGDNATVNLMNCKHGSAESKLTGHGTFADGSTTTMAQAGLIFMQANTELNIYDGITMELLERKDTAGNLLYPNEGGIIATSNGTVINMYGGTLKNGRAAKTGGSIHLTGASSLYIMGGEILDGMATTFGGNIYVSTGSVLEITGGTVSGGTAVNGGNIYTTTNEEKPRTVKLSGNYTISGGKATGNDVVHGGNIVVEGYTTLNISGGEITEGKAESTVHDEINELGGNIYIGTSANLIMTGGTVSNGNAYDLGGNIYLAYNSEGNEISGGNILTGNARSGGNIYADNSSVLTISDGTISGGIVSSNGGNLATGRSTNVTVSGGAIQNGEAAAGGNIYAGSDTADEIAVLNVSGGNIIGGTATNGGSIYADQYAIVTLSSGKITGGTATSYGGAVYAATSSSVKLTGITVSGGNATNGGSICAADSSAVELSSGTVSGGVATNNGGSIYAAMNSDIKLTGATVSGGTAQGGGNIYVSTNAIVTMTGGKITGGNAAANGGGNILCAGSEAKFVMEGGTVENGTSTDGHGGNINVHSGASAEITGGIVQNGTVKKVSNSDRHGGNLTLSGNGTKVTIADTAQILGGTSANYAGNIFYHSGDLTIGGTAKITKGTATQGGQCVHQNWTTNGTVGETVYAGTMIITGSPNIYDIDLGDDNDTIQLKEMTSGASIGVSSGSMNYKFAVADQAGYADYFHSNNPYYYDVVEQVNDGIIELWYAGHASHCVCAGTYEGTESACDHKAISGEWKIWDGKSISTGGNYYLTDDFVLADQVWMGGSADNNTEMTINLCLNGHSIESAYRVFGVAPKVTFNLMNCSGEAVTLKGHCASASDGGALRIHGDSSVMNMYGNIVIETKAVADRTVRNGGTVYNVGTFNMYGGTVQGKSATHGGAVYNVGTFNMYDGTVQGASATNGGAIYSTGTITMNGGEIIGAAVGVADTTRGLGGAVYLSGGSFTLNAGTIQGATVNSSTDLRGAGGAIYMVGSGTSSFTMKGGSIYGGSGKLSGDSTRAHGGVAYLESGTTFTVEGGTIYGSSVGDGAVFFGNGATINITDGTIYAGFAQFGGGAIKVSSSSELNMSGGSIIGSADASYSESGLTYKVNAQTAGGGALFVDGSSAVTINGDAVISGCTTTSQGGALQVYNKDATITVGGSVQIVNNYKVNSDGSNPVNNNIHLDYASGNSTIAKALVIDESGLTTGESGAKIGVTISSGRYALTDGHVIVAENGTAYASVFQADDSTNYQVVDTNGVLSLEAVTE